MNMLRLLSCAALLFFASASYSREYSPFSLWKNVPGSEEVDYRYREAQPDLQSSMPICWLQLQFRNRGKESLLLRFSWMAYAYDEFGDSKNRKLLGYQVSLPAGSYKSLRTESGALGQSRYCKGDQMMSAELNKY